MPVIDISELPENIQEVEAAPIRPGSPPLGGPPSKNDIPNYFSGTIAPQLQHDGTFVGMKYQTPGIPSHPIMPVAPSGQAANNAATISVIKQTTSTTTSTPDAQTNEMNWRGNWSSAVPYAVDDVVQFNISTYLALTANTNVKPDQNPGTWALVSKNLNFRGVYGSQGPNYPTLNYWSSNASSSLTTSFTWTINPALATWQTSHNYSLGVKIIDSNGNQQTVITAGTSQPVSHPTWNTNVGGQTIDNPGPNQVVWVNGGVAQAITIGDVIFVVADASPTSGSATISLTDSSGNAWNQVGPTETTTNGVNGRNVTLQMFYTVATKNVASGGAYSITVNTTAASDTGLTAAGFSSAVGTLNASSGANSGGSGPLAPGALTLDITSFMIYGSYTTHTSGFTGSTPPWNRLSTGSGFAQKDMYWAVIEAGVVNPATNSVGGGGLMAIMGQFTNQGTNLNYVPFDVVLYNGSTYVCVGETSASPRTDTTNWVLLSQGTGTVVNLIGNVNATGFNDGALFLNLSSSSWTVTLPGTPSSPWWWAAFQNSGTGTIVINPGGANLDGSSSSLTLVQNQGVLIFTDGNQYYTEKGFGTVFSVGLSLPNIFTVTVSPITTSGTLTAVLANQNANLMFAGPSSGGAATPTFRALANADLPITVPTVPTAEFQLTGNVASPAGSLAITKQLQNPHLVWAGPGSPGASAQPTFRLLTAGDIPTLAQPPLAILAAFGSLTTGSVSGTFRLNGMVLPAGVYRVSANFFMQANVGAGNLDINIGWNDGTAARTATNGTNGMPTDILTTALNMAQGETILVSDGIHDVTWAMTLT